MAYWDTPYDPTEHWPRWVKICLWHSTAKYAAWRWFYLITACAVTAASFRCWWLSPPLTIASVAIYSAIKWIETHADWTPSRQPRKVKLRMWSAVFTLLILSALRLFFLDYYRIPQNGMYPTLPADSLLLTWQHPYADPSQVRRGDIVAFRYREKADNYIFIWRIIALPGETVTASGDDVIVNGQAPERELISEFEGQAIFAERWAGAAYRIALDQLPATTPPSIAITVPPGAFFVMGDNRYNARDSRYIGTVPFAAIIGKKL